MSLDEVLKTYYNNDAFKLFQMRSNSQPPDITEAHFLWQAAFHSLSQVEGHFLSVAVLAQWSLCACNPLC